MPVLKFVFPSVHPGQCQLCPLALEAGEEEIKPMQETLHIFNDIYTCCYTTQE